MHLRLSADLVPSIPSSKSVDFQTICTDTSQIVEEISIKCTIFSITSSIIFDFHFSSYELLKRKGLKADKLLYKYLTVFLYH